MKVKDVMQKNVLSVTEDTSLKKIARLMFSTHVAGYPVLRDKKLVGFITADDLFMKAKEARGNDKSAGTSLNELFKKTVKDIMVSDVMTLGPDASLSDAQDIMTENYFARLPIVDGKNELVGIISYSDVFREIISAEIPELEMDQYVSFVLENYDQMVNWEKRFDLEFPTLFRVFNKHKVKKVLDLGFWTGAYTIELAKEGMEVVGVDHNSTLVAAANEKKAKLPTSTKKKLSFELANYDSLDKQFPAGEFGAVICVGNALPYMQIDPAVVLKSVHKLIKKDGVMVLQLLNLERVIEQRKRFYYFRIKQGEVAGTDEELYVEFYDKKDEHTITQNILNFISNGKSWKYKGINSLDIKYIKNDDVEKMAKDAGFKEIIITGNKGEEEGQYGHMSLIKPFDPVTSEWMTVIASK